MIIRIIILIIYSDRFRIIAVEIESDQMKLIESSDNQKIIGDIVLILLLRLKKHQKNVNMQLIYHQNLVYNIIYLYRRSSFR